MNNSNNNKNNNNNNNNRMVPTIKKNNQELAWRDYIKVPIGNLDGLHPDVFDFARDYLIAGHDLVNYFIDPVRLFHVIYVDKTYADASYPEGSLERDSANENYWEYVGNSQEQTTRTVVNYYTQKLQERATVTLFFGDLYQMWDRLSTLHQRPIGEAAGRAYDIFRLTKPYIHRNFPKPVQNSVANALRGYRHDLERSLPTNAGPSGIFLNPNNASLHPFANPNVFSYNGGGQISLERKIRKIRHYNRKIKYLLATL
jgi:hypothetical protein